MVTIAKIVEKQIEEKPFLQEALSRGIINNAALAEQLIPIVEKKALPGLLLAGIKIQSIL